MAKLFSLESLKVAGKQIVNNIFASFAFIPSYFLVKSGFVVTGSILTIFLFYVYLNLLGWFGRIFWKWS